MHKFPIGQAVEYKPMSGKVNLYTVVRQMPCEASQIDFRYRIKNDNEGFERNVMECDLTIAERPPNLYGFVKQLRRTGGHH